MYVTILLFSKDLPCSSTHTFCSRLQAPWFHRRGYWVFPESTYAPILSRHYHCQTGDHITPLLVDRRPESLTAWGLDREVDVAEPLSLRFRIVCSVAATTWSREYCRGAGEEEILANVLFLLLQTASFSLSNIQHLSNFSCSNPSVFSNEFLGTFHGVLNVLHWQLPRWSFVRHFFLPGLTLNPLTWKIWWAPIKASRWQLGFNSAFKG